MSNLDVAEAARAVVRRVGIQALTLAAVAREAGISRATMYRRYASRDQLVEAVINAELDALETVLLNRLRFTDEPRDTVYMMSREVLNHLANHDALQAALRIDGSLLLPWLIRSDDRPTLVDIVADRALSQVAESPLAQHLTPNPRVAVEFMVSVIYAELLSPARHQTHAQLATYIASATVADRAVYSET